MKSEEVAGRRGRNIRNRNRGTIYGRSDKQTAAQLRGLANGIDTILIVGKDGIGDNLVKQADDALEARELIKGKVLENSLLSAREAAEALAPRTRSEVVQVIGQNSCYIVQVIRRTKRTRSFCERQEAGIIRRERPAEVSADRLYGPCGRRKASPHRGEGGPQGRMRGRNERGITSVGTLISQPYG